MANGWAPDGAVQDQIEDTVKDAVLSARARMPSGESAIECDDCGEPIPEKRRLVLAGVRTCGRASGVRLNGTVRPAYPESIGAVVRIASYADGQDYGRNLNPTG